MYFKFFKLHSWGKRSADNRRRLIQRLLEAPADTHRRGFLHARKAEVRRLGILQNSLVPKNRKAC